MVDLVGCENRPLPVFWTTSGTFLVALYVVAFVEFICHNGGVLSRYIYKYQYFAEVPLLCGLFCLLTQKLLISFFKVDFHNALVLLQFAPSV